MHSKRIREKVKQDYDSIAESFSETRQHAWPEFDFFKSYLKPNYKVLDLGCGNGRLVDFLKKQGVSDYVGVDQSRGLLNLARKAHPDRLFLEGDMADLSLLDFKPQSFDAVFMMASFHHLPKKDQMPVLKAVHDLLKPGGFLFMTHWNLFQKSFWKSWLKMLFYRPYGWKGLPIPWQNGIERYYYAFTPSELRKLFRETDLDLLEMQAGRNFVTICKR